MYIVKRTSQFKRAYKRAKKRNMNISLLKDVVNKLRSGIPLDRKYEDHPLQGKLKGTRECHIEPDWLLIYMIENDILTLTLIDTGSHSDLFDM